MKSRRYSRATTAVIAVACLVAAGCLPYAYPKLAYIPSADLGPEVNDVHAFRVDAEKSLALYNFGDCNNHKLTEIAPRADGTLPSQLRATIENRVAHLDNCYYFSGGCVHETLVRLYRPGYLLVELKSWDPTEKIVWQPAPDWRSQREALLDLLAPPHGSRFPLSLANASSCSVDWVWNRFLPLAPTTPQTQRVFDVAVAECERLEKNSPTSEDAAKVRDLAQKLIERKSTALKSEK